MEIGELAEQLKKEPVVAVSTPEVKAEVVPEVIPAATPEAVVEPEAKPVAEVKKDEFTPSERVQARFDALTERLIEKDKKLAELEKKIEAVTPKPETEATDEQIQALLNDPSQTQYHGWAANELARRQSSRTEQNIMQKLQMQSQVTRSYEAAKAEFPDIADKTTALWAKANEIYIAKGLDRDPDGQYIAALLASRLIPKPEVADTVSAEVSEKRVGKEAAKKGLVQVSKKVVATPEDRIAKLEKEAFTAGAGSHQMINYLRELENDRLAKKKLK